MFFPEPSTVRRGTLSEAADKASDKHSGNRQVADSHRRDAFVNRHGEPDRAGMFTTEAAHTPVGAGERVAFQAPGSMLNPNPDSLPEDSDAVTRADSASAVAVIDTVYPPAPDSLLRAVADSSGTVHVGKLVRGLGPPSGAYRRATVTLREHSMYDAGSGADTAMAKHGGDTPDVGVVEGVRERSTVFLGVEAFSAYAGSRMYSNVNGGQALVAFYPAERQRHSIGLGLGAVRMQQGEPIERMASNALVFYLDFQYRRYINPDHTFMGMFILGGLGFRVLSWEYRNPVTSDVYDEYGNYLKTDEVGSDRVTGISGDLGFGIALVRTRHYRLSVEPCIGGVLNWFETGEGFENDVFKPEWYVRLSLESAWGIGRD